jgi:hypothetical protein
LKHSGRKLTWKHSLAHCQLRAAFPRGNKELVVSGFQAVILLLFNDIPADKHLSYTEIRASCGLVDAELRRTLQSLACAKYQVLRKHPRGREVNDTDTFTFNSTFQDAKLRIKINQIQLKETKEENKETHERVAADRHYETQAAIVRIMKSRKKIGHNDLIVEVIKATMSRGVLDQADIKRNIEKLVPLPPFPSQYLVLTLLNQVDRERLHGARRGELVLLRRVVECTVDSRGRLEGFLFLFFSPEYENARQAVRRLICMALTCAGRRRHSRSSPQSAYRNQTTSRRRRHRYDGIRETPSRMRLDQSRYQVHMVQCIVKHDKAQAKASTRSRRLLFYSSHTAPESSFCSPSSLPFCSRLSLPIRSIKCIHLLYSQRKAESKAESKARLSIVNYARDIFLHHIY